MSNADLLQFWFSWIASATLQMAFFVPLVAIASRALKGFPARFRYALWFLVVFKAFIPPGVVLPWTVSGAGLSSASTGAVKVVALFADPIIGHHGVQRAGLDLGLSDPVWTEPVLRGMVQYLGNAGAAALLCAWLIGVGIFWIMTLMQQWKTANLVSGARRISDGPIHDELLRLARSIGLSRIPKLVLSSEVSGPFLCGFFRPTIVLPAELPGLVGVSDLRAVLLHELVHYKRGDLLACWTQVVAQSIFWFHPLVWWANARIADEREFCVDEAVVESRGIEVIAYARALVEVAAISLRGFQGALAFLGLTRRRSELERRVEHLLQPAVVRPAAQLVAWCSLFFFAVAFVPGGVPASGSPGAPQGPPARIAQLPG